MDERERRLWYEPAPLTTLARSHTDSPFCRTAESAWMNMATEAGTQTIGGPNSPVMDMFDLSNKLPGYDYFPYSEVMAFPGSGPDIEFQTEMEPFLAEDGFDFNIPEVNPENRTLDLIRDWSSPGLDPVFSLRSLPCPDSDGKGGILRGPNEPSVHKSAYQVSCNDMNLPKLSQLGPQPIRDTSSALPARVVSGIYLFSSYEFGLVDLGPTITCKFARQKILP